MNLTPEVLAALEITGPVIWKENRDRYVITYTLTFPPEVTPGAILYADAVSSLPNKYPSIDNEEHLSPREVDNHLRCHFHDRLQARATELGMIYVMAGHWRENGLEITCAFWSAMSSTRRTWALGHHADPVQACALAIIELDRRSKEKKAFMDPGASEGDHTVETTVDAATGKIIEFHRSAGQIIEDAGHANALKGRKINLRRMGDNPNV